MQVESVVISAFSSVRHLKMGSQGGEQLNTEEEQLNNEEELPNNEEDEELNPLRRAIRAILGVAGRARRVLSMSERNRRRYERETPETRRERLDQMFERMHEHRASQDQEARISSQERNTAGMRRNRQREDEEVRAERLRRNRENMRRRREAASAARPGPVAENSSNQPNRDPAMEDHWARATRRFENIFINNHFGYACDVCDRLWFESDLKAIRENHIQILRPLFGDRSRSFRVCSTCWSHLEKNQVPFFSTTNGFKYPPKPPHLPPLNPISVRLISPRIPFMSIRRLTRRNGQYAITGQVINMPINVQETIQQLPRQLHDDHALNVCLKRKLIHRSSYLRNRRSRRDTVHILHN